MCLLINKLYTDVVLFFLGLDYEMEFKHKKVNIKMCAYSNTHDNGRR